MSKNLLERVIVANPCTMDWEEMSGDAQKRYCSHCDKHVYNLSQMPRREAENLLRLTNGKLCARFERNADGTIRSMDEIVSLPRFNQQFLRLAATTMSAALSLAPTINAKPVRNLPVLNLSQESKGKGELQIGTTSDLATIFGTIKDEMQMPLSFAIVTISEVGGTYSKTTITKQGKYEFKNLSIGKYTISAFSPGLTRFLSPEINVSTNQSSQFDINLTTTTVTMGSVSIETWPQRMRRKLAHAFLLPVRKLKSALSS